MLAEELGRLAGNAQKWFIVAILDRMFANEFFNTETSNLVQIISFCMEVVGIPLAAIQFFRPQLNKYLENQLIFLADFCKKVMNGVKNVYQIGNQIEDAIDLNELKVVRILPKLIYNTILIVAVVSFISSLTGYNEWSLHFLAFSFWGFVFILFGTPVILISVVILTQLLSLLLRFLSRFSQNRPLGMLGFVLTILGGLGELYQIITLTIEKTNSVTP